jgi:hypothetical protein
MNSLISAVNSEASAEETHLAVRRSSSMPLKARSFFRNRMRFWAE